MKKKKKNILLILLIIPAMILAYVVYVFTDYHRLGNMELSPNGTAVCGDTIDFSSASGNTSSAGKDNGSGSVSADSSAVSQEFEITTWNIGFAAYTADYGFFMDGGKESRARSEDSVLNNMLSISEKLNSYDSDFLFIQEVDKDSTRTYHIDEVENLRQNVLEDYEMNGTDAPSPDENASVDDLLNLTEMDLVSVPRYSWVFCQNFDSPYLFYPIREPHGASRSGLITASRYDISESERVELPVQTNVAKIVDLDRCYDKSVVPVTKADGSRADLVLFNFHLSAYTTDPTIVEQQLNILYKDMVSEYEAGNYVVAGGDFNKDLLGDSGSVFGVSGDNHNWAQSFPFDTIPDGITLQVACDKANPVPSCRNADGPWDSETQFQVTIDGFMVSDNVSVSDIAVIDTQFENSDHNPVTMHFSLN